MILRIPAGYGFIIELLTMVNEVSNPLKFANEEFYLQISSGGSDRT